MNKTNFFPSKGSPFLVSLLLFLVWGVLMPNVRGEQVEKMFLSDVFSTDRGSIPYRMLIPENYDSGKEYPLVLFFHGAGERGDDNRKQLVHGMPRFAADEIRKGFPCFVVAPQCPEGEKWVDTPWGKEQHKMSPKATLPLELSLALVESLQKKYSIDPQRLYLTGLSMGGFAVWEVLQRYPKQFAAAVPICGGGDPSYATVMAQVPIWAFHSDNDQAVKPERTEAMIQAIKSAGGKPRYTQYHGLGHNAWTPTYANRELFVWMFAQQLQE